MKKKKARKQMLLSRKECTLTEAELKKIAAGRFPVGERAKYYPSSYEWPDDWAPKRAG